MKKSTTSLLLKYYKHGLPKLINVCSKTFMRDFFRFDLRKENLILLFLYNSLSKCTYDIYLLDPISYMYSLLETMLIGKDMERVSVSLCVCMHVFPFYSAR